ncbi:hypothetical protein MRX96_003789 [Rhipicephalus microplus]
MRCPDEAIALDYRGAILEPATRAHYVLWMDGTRPPALRSLRFDRLLMRTRHGRTKGGRPLYTHAVPPRPEKGSIIEEWAPCIHSHLPANLLLRNECPNAVASRGLPWG